MSLYKMENTKDGRVRVLSQEEQQEIKDLYLNDMYGSWRISRLMHVNLGVVNRFLEAEGIKRNKEEMYKARTKQYEVKFDDDELDTMVERYNNGTSIYTLRKELKLSNKPIVNALLKRGVKIRDRHEAKANQKAINRKRKEQ